MGGDFSMGYNPHVLYAVTRIGTVIVPRFHGPALEMRTSISFPNSEIEFELLFFQQGAPVHKQKSARDHEGDHDG